jgi:TolB-like protein
MLGEGSGAAISSAAELKTHCPTRHAEQQPSIAVLPFGNMSADKENEYFSDGLTEEIINVLAHVPGRKVAGRTASFFSVEGTSIRRDRQEAERRAYCRWECA